MSNSGPVLEIQLWNSSLSVILACIVGDQRLIVTNICACMFTNNRRVVIQEFLERGYYEN